MTQFVSAAVQTPYGALHLDGNSKITCELGTYQQPVANALSLPHISTCPGSTRACREGCYVHGLQAHASETYELYRLNERVIHRALLSPMSAERTASALVGHLRENEITRFRWHVSGDVFSTRHAEWIARVCQLAPETRFWIYTRTLHAVRVLAGLENLTVNVSADVDNYQDAAECARTFDLNLCYFMREGDDLEDADVIFPDYPLRGRKLARPTDTAFWQALTKSERRRVCPADYFGQSEHIRCGPCKKCL